ncbi:MAG: uracil-xanthine permease [Clostridia bacterium]|nr:uracil-xanthine permease [Clostridia bacterium]
MEEKVELTLDVNQKPSIGKWIILAIQHVFAMFGATILVPILVNSGAGEEVLTIPVALVSSGIGTLIYILCTKGKSPVYLGSSFAFIAPLIAAYLKGGISGAMTGIMVVGLVYVVFALLVKIIGKNWINKLLPPIVIGPMIMIIGLGLAPSAIGQIGLTSGTAIDWKVIVVALVSFLVTAIVAVAAKGFFKVIPFLIGIVSGYLAAIAVGIVDFTLITEAAIVGVPNFVIPFIHYTPNFGAVLTIAPIALVTMAEHIGDHTALSAIIGKDLLKEPGLDRTLLGDGLATFFAGLVGGPANTTYGENTSVVGMTKVASVWVIGLAAIIAIVLGFFSKFTAVISTIPNAVLGGVSLLLYGFIAVNGLKVLIQNQVDFGKTKNVIVASAMLVLGLGGAAIAINSGDVSVTISGMSLAAIVGIILNLCLPNGEDKKEEKLEVEKIEDTKTEKEEKKTKTSKPKASKKVKEEKPKKEKKPAEAKTSKNTSSKTKTTKRKVAAKAK